MSGGFDPYYKWLGIPPKDQPPNHYRLLAIEVYESDREVIDAAANRLMAYLKALATGEDLASSQKLLNEVAAARRCLLDPPAKAAYDAQLRARVAGNSPVVAPVVAPVATPPAPPAAPAVADGESVDLDFLAASPRQPAPPVPRAKPGPMPRIPTMWLGIAAIALMGLVTVVVAMILSGGSEPSHSRPQAPAKRPVVPRSDTAVARPSAFPAEFPASASEGTWRPPFQDAGGSLPPLQSNVPELPPSQPAAPPAPPAAPPANPSSPAKSETSPAKPAPPADPFASLPKALELPLLRADAAREPALLGALHLNGRNARLKLLGADEVLVASAAFALTAVEPAKTDRWRVEIRETNAAAKPVAEFSLHDGELRFGWLPGIDSTQAEVVRSCLLEITVGQAVQTRPLRATLSIDALPLVNVDASERVKPVIVVVPGMPETSRLELEILAVSGLPPFEAKFEPPKRLGIDDELDLPLGKHEEFPPVVSIAMSRRDDKLMLKTWLSIKPPVAVRGPKKFVPFSAKNFLRDLRDLPKMEASYEENRPSRNPSHAQRRPEERKKLDDEYAQRTAPLAARINYLKHVRDMEKLAPSLRDKVRLHFVIFTTVAGQRVDLVRTAK